FKDWLFVELIGVVIGGVLSAVIAKRFRFAIERGPRVADRTRMFTAFGGGALMGVGARLARGCTSGLGLTGGSLLAVGSWVFVIAAFAAAFAVAPFVRKLWV
ncbi:MAG TPA: YeeE/YedE thiosulfate transporter family protein, partial [Longimicrobiales bacterium]|nr:YeeE/YedE thiosulfate transporter family protein [Longimicrobiales bacterium]